MERRSAEYKNEGAVRITSGGFVMCGPGEKCMRALGRSEVEFPMQGHVGLGLVQLVN